ncbi:hypothetical protein [Paenibacillus glacialis]|uniref:Uncharacterized protein n=1 Tax=Paenibacillus glacialis TaxID=494026 RepID=A0A162LY96_9BACL|nr:hypothetical protein PGLA_15710 [Paenibacillus glacialis]
MKESSVRVNILNERSVMIGNQMFKFIDESEWKHVNKKQIQSEDTKKRVADAARSLFDSERI